MANFAAWNLWVALRSLARLVLRPRGPGDNGDIGESGVMGLVGDKGASSSPVEPARPIVSVSGSSSFASRAGFAEAVALTGPPQGRPHRRIALHV
eukprot:CAMPEP_0178453284 /NCGR_PEP_ID=MMETSP0689_2-20121128/44727_1 /TAXON_ID=160604 /ORGANISM="Amphidinium massartii, Strain CS-259" /LENGTH=94 /DNA_ID=CAMNT_0020079109 /DNA_START=514 /DNA_END=799 /DNA_ORIENTATION=-